MNRRDEELTLLDALEYFSERDAWQEYVRLQRFHGPRVVWVGGLLNAEDALAYRAVELRQQLKSNLIAQLKEGFLVARAYVAPLRADSQRINIPAEKWTLLSVNFEQSTASGYGLDLFGIRVRKSETSPTSQRGRKPDVLSQRQLIHAAFESLLEASQVNFSRGGLTAVAAKLALQFPEYKLDTIRRIIQPAFRSRQSQS
jgi:hypothetical protein